MHGWTNGLVAAGECRLRTKVRAGTANGTGGGSGKLNEDSFCNLIALPTNVMQRLN